MTTHAMRRPGIQLSITLFALLAAASATSQTPASFSRSDLAAAQALLKRAQGDSTAYQLAESLTTEVGPRFSGTPGDRAAVVWAQEEMRRLGFENVHTQEVDVPQWVRGEAEFAVLEPWPQPMPTLALGGTVGTPNSGIEAEAVMVKDLAALTALPAGAVKDRIVFFNNPIERRRDWVEYSRAVSVRGAGPSAASALGAVGVVIRSISTSAQRFPHTGGSRQPQDVPRIPAMAISNPDADALQRQFASGRTVRLRIKSTARELPKQRSANVIGEIPGTDLAQEIVILGAHLDSWDMGVGAIDNAAGVGLVLTAAHLIHAQGLKPRRTLRVVLFANEENGSAGSRAYFAAQEQTLANHVLGLESDYGAGPVWQFSTRVNPADVGVIDQMYRVLRPLKMDRGTNEAPGNADLSPFVARGMPILGPELDGTYYLDVHHTANDTMAQIDPAAIRQSAATYAVGVWLGAQYAGKWQRLPPKPPRR
ncbi:MAG: M20/M25/M40 family metallo-hydrolase [Pseudomonadota bacterium]